MNCSDPLQVVKNLLDRDILFLDGAFGTYVEYLGCNISTDSLWCSQLLMNNEDMIVRVHFDYLLNGQCDIIITSSYQAYVDGFANLFDLNYQQSIAKITLSMYLANKAIERLLKYRLKTKPKHFIIAGSVGCYGSHLNNRSEYTGDYGPQINEYILRAYHSETMHALMNFHTQSTNDTNIEIVLACESIPNLMEVRVMVELLNEYKYCGWISMCCKNGTQLSSNEYVRDAIEYIVKHNYNRYCIGIGFNCTHPQYICSLLRIAKEVIENSEIKNGGIYHLIVYPNRGELWNIAKHEWSTDHSSNISDLHFAKLALEWYKLGADIIGGCCRTDPTTIKCVQDTILSFIANKNKLESRYLKNKEIRSKL